jgi:hypothetical protein
MTQNASFIRKVSYIAAIAVLLIPLSYLSQPATTKSSGGKLAQLRTEYELSQARLGDIDPASETMKLATLGMGGVAANVLWVKALDDKKHEDFDGFSAACNQIIKLQPNFIAVWEHQAHNLSYNISVEFDGYRDRYHWVKKGIEFLITGTQYNRSEPRLLHTIGWYFGQKIGRADEHLQFRRLYRDDTDFHNSLADYVTVDDSRGAIGYDNWLMGRLWYLEAQRVVDTKAKPIRGTSPLLFHSAPTMSLVNYALAIEEEGILDEVAQRAWRNAGESFKEYGSRQIPSSFGHTIVLSAKESVDEEAAKLRKRLDEELAPGIREQIYQDKLAKLKPAERDALNVPMEKRNEQEHTLVYNAQPKIAVMHVEVAELTSPDKREQAKQLAAEIHRLETLSQRIQNYRNIVNFQIWTMRCEAEATDEAIRARKDIYDAGRLYEQAILTEYKDSQTGETKLGAKETYDRAWDEWAKVFEKYPSLMTDIATKDLMQSVDEYRRLCESLVIDKDQMDPIRRLPKDFKLMKFVDYHEERYLRSPELRPTEENSPTESNTP